MARVAKAKVQPEALLQAHVYSYLSSCPEYFGFSVRNGGTYDPRIGAYRANRGPGSRKGISDLVGSWRGQLFCIEIKTPEGRMSPEQKMFREDVIKAGGLHAVVRSVEEIVDFVRSMRFVTSKTMLRLSEEE